MMNRLKMDTRTIYDRHRSDIPDSKGLVSLEVACFVLASYRELLRAGVAEDEAFKSIRRAYTAVFATTVNLTMKILLFFVPDPVAVKRKLPSSHFSGLHWVDGSRLRMRGRTRTI